MDFSNIKGIKLDELIKTVVKERCEITISFTPETVTPIKKRVTHDEFVTFVQNYPRKLTYDAFGAFDPPLVTYNDFELANRWPFSVVASTRLYDEDPKGYFYESPDKRDYYIVTNYDELYASKTGYKAGENE